MHIYMLTIISCKIIFPRLQPASNGLQDSIFNLKLNPKHILHCAFHNSMNHWHPKSNPWTKLGIWWIQSSITYASTYGNNRNLIRQTDLQNSCWTSCSKSKNPNWISIQKTEKPLATLIPLTDIRKFMCHQRGGRSCLTDLLTAPPGSLLVMSKM